MPFFWFTAFVLVGIALILVLGLRKQARQIVREFDHDTVFRMYSGFAIPLPQGYQVHGIDVSRYQGQINWPLVKAMKTEGVRLQFAFLKATEGSGLVDMKFSRNWRKCKQAGLARGAYHFFRPGVSGITQARLFLKTVKLESGDLPPVLDVEVAGGYPSKTIRKQVAEWLNQVEAALGVKPILYTNPSFYRDYLGSAFDDYRLWVAHYKVRHAPSVPRHWHFWQHNESGRVSGIDAYVDFNVFYGDSAAFRSLLMP
jgi:lysozyme